MRAAIETFRLVGVAAGLAPDEALELESRVYDDAARALSIDPTLGENVSRRRTAKQLEPALGIAKSGESEPSYDPVEGFSHRLPVEWLTDLNLRLLQSTEIQTRSRTVSYRRSLFP